MPGGNQAARDGLANCRNFDFEAHEKRGATENQYRAGVTRDLWDLSHKGASHGSCYCASTELATRPAPLHSSLRPTAPAANQCGFTSTHGLTCIEWQAKSRIT